MSEDALLIIGAFILIIGGFIVYLSFLNKIVLANYQKIIVKYPNLQLTKDENSEYSDHAGHLLKGEIDGFEFVCYQSKTGRGKYARNWTHFILTHGQDLGEFRLKFVSEYFYHRMVKSADFVKDAEIGNSSFDRRFLIETNDIEKTKEILSSNVQEKLLDLNNIYFGELKINGTKLLYKASYHLENNMRYRQFEKVIDAGLAIIRDMEKSGNL